MLINKSCGKNGIIAPKGESIPISSTQHGTGVAGLPALGWEGGGENSPTRTATPAKF